MSLRMSVNRGRPEVRGARSKRETLLHSVFPSDGRALGRRQSRMRYELDFDRLVPVVVERRRNGRMVGQGMLAFRNVSASIRDALTISFSQRRPRAMALTSRAPRSAQSGPTHSRVVPCGSRISRSRSNGVRLRLSDEVFSAFKVGRLALDVLRDRTKPG